MAHSLQDRLRELGTAPLRTRFAPSPTGYLHIGHVVHGLYVWGIAAATGAQVILRLENHDTTRCKPAFEQALLEDLEWLGLMPDLPALQDLRDQPSDFRQSDCQQHYIDAVAHLQAQGLVYACSCTRKQILARSASQTLGQELRYDGHCRDLGLAFTPEMTLRFRLPAEKVEFEDLALGTQQQRPLEEVGDFAIRDNHGHWTYQFCVVVDDMRQGINLIVRGMDILSSTGRQILLARALGHEQQAYYYHHPLLTDAAGRKLSKRDLDEDIHTWKLSGMKADVVLGLAAHRAHWQSTNNALGLRQALDCVKRIVGE